VAGSVGRLRAMDDSPLARAYGTRQLTKVVVFCSRGMATVPVAVAMVSIRVGRQLPSFNSLTLLAVSSSRRG